MRNTTIENSYEKTIGEIGVRQFVRNIMVDEIANGQGKEVEDVIRKMNIRILEDFKVLAQDEAKKVLKEVKNLVAKKA